MRFLKILCLFAFSFLLVMCTNSADTPTETTASATSPNGKLVAHLMLNETGEPHYTVLYGQDTLIAPSPLGFELQDAPALLDNFTITNVTPTTANETWETVWGEQREIRDHYRGFTISLQQQDEPARQLRIAFRVYNEGIGFRYEFPEQANLDSFNITNEKTGFHLVGDPTCWWNPANYDSYEMLYKETPLSQVSSTEWEGSQIANTEATNNAENIPNQDRIRKGAMNTPVTLKTEQGLYLSLHEANLTDYAGMTLKINENNFSHLEAELVPWPDGIKVKAQAPFVSPWRMIIVGEQPGDLIENSLMALNLNEPNKISDVSWIKPMKYVGIWWAMHIGKYTWGMSETHGATNENVKRYIDFAAEHDLGGVLVEGWNTGWENWGKEGAFDYTTAYPDFDLQALVDYGQEKGVALIGHHETGGDVPSYDRRLEEAFKLYNEVGVHSVKTGYAGPMRPEGQFHHNQWMVRHYRRVVEMGAQYQIAIDAHEPIKDTGIRRTYPNMMTREGVRGQEYNAWSEGNPPGYLTTLPFTRMLAGPLDYTPGIFNITFEGYGQDHRVYSTLANQLALMVVLYSPLQMAADLPEHYNEHPDALQFIEEVGIDWEQSQVLNGEIGQYVTIARQERGSDRWFVGSITNESARELTIALDFLPADQPYQAKLYQDAADADFESNPVAYTIEEKSVTAADSLTLTLAPGGGTAISLLPVEN